MNSDKYFKVTREQEGRRTWSGVCIAYHHVGVCIAHHHVGVCIACHHAGVCIAHHAQITKPGCYAYQEHEYTLALILGGDTCLCEFVTHVHVQSAKSDQ